MRKVFVVPAQWLGTFCALGAVLACPAPGSDGEAGSMTTPAAGALQNPEVQRKALAVAREALSKWLDNPQQRPPRPSADGALPAVLRSRYAVIVTLEKPGQVAPRGCRGTLAPAYSNLAAEIAANAVAAASRDKRVPVLRRDELAACRISLTVILKIVPIQSLDQHDAEHCGLLARSGGRIGLVVPYEGHDAATQWQWARQKAGLKPGEPAEMAEIYAVRFKEPAN